MRNKKGMDMGETEGGEEMNSSGRRNCNQDIIYVRKTKSSRLLPPN